MKHPRIERFADLGLDTPTLEQLRLLAQALERSAMFVPAELLGTERARTTEPQWQALFTESPPCATHWPTPRADGDYSGLEARVAAMHPGFAEPYGRPLSGLYRLSGANGAYKVRGVSGNARQRRRQVRVWRRQGYTVQPH